MRLAAYEDGVYHADGAVLSAERAFPLFMFGLAEDPDVERLTVLGRLHPQPGRSHYVVPGAVVATAPAATSGAAAPGGAAAGPGGPARAEFVPLPWYPSLADVAAVARAAPATLARFWRVLGGVDAIWVCGPTPVAVLVVLLALARRRRVVLGVRQDTLAYARSRFPRSRAARLAFRLLETAWRALARATAVAAVGPQLHALYAGARRHELAVSFVRADDLAGEEVEARRSYDGEIALLSVGRLETEKNPLLLADVLARLDERFRLRIVGEGPLEPALRERLAQLGVAGRADLLGYVPLDGGLLDLYRSSDLLLHVSWTEGLPQVLLEAFGARLPVVATEVGGVGAVARGAALLVAPGDADAAAGAVRRLAGDAELRHRLAAEGLRRARERTAEAERRRLVRFIAG